ncbi:tyrosine-type recombinase/integrase [Clostridium transplantifaecale]|uniref:tyrosine-type recombinase/integrase n=1 Tax=Clostridium transplantifaecale TaxID=2479838 RepID=UPI000F632797|nr:tyrosine-type recombinase/integrase [Clostridium transplantifaecale]
MQELLENSLDGFRVHLEKQGRSAKTITSYTCSVSLFFSLDYELSVENLKSYREYLLKNYQFNTVNARIYGMNRYLSYLQEIGQLPFSLMLSNTEYSAPQEPVDLNSVKKTRDGSYRMQSVKEQKKSYLDTVISQRDYERMKKRLKNDGNMYWYFVIRFLGATGARVSELLQIKIEDLRLGYLDLYTKGGKIRRLYFPRSLCAEAIPWFMEKGIKSGFIFLNRHGNLITSRGIELRLKHFAKLYKINPKTVYPHSFRHRFAKNFLKRFNDISLLADLMGHDSIETTRIYLTRSSQEQKALLDRIITW